VKKKVNIININVVLFAKIGKVVNVKILESQKLSVSPDRSTW